LTEVGSSSELIASTAIAIAMRPMLLTASGFLSGQSFGTERALSPSFGRPLGSAIKLT